MAQIIGLFENKINATYTPLPHPLLSFPVYKPVCLLEKSIFQLYLRSLPPPDLSPSRNHIFHINLLTFSLNIVLQMEISN